MEEKIEDAYIFHNSQTVQQFGNTSHPSPRRSLASLSRNKIGQAATTFTDLRKHRVFDVILGRSEQSLKGYLLKLKGRERVRLVTMDLSETNRGIVHKYFPNARIVVDRFHVVRV